MEEALEKDVGSGGWVGESTILEESLFFQLSVFHLLCLAYSDFKDTVIPLECIKHFPGLYFYAFCNSYYSVKLSVFKRLFNNKLRTILGKSVWEKYFVMRGSVDTWKKDGSRLWFCYSRLG